MPCPVQLERFETRARGAYLLALKVLNINRDSLTRRVDSIACYLGTSANCSTLFFIFSIICSISIIEITLARFLLTNSLTPFTRRTERGTYHSLSRVSQPHSHHHSSTQSVLPALERPSPGHLAAVRVCIPLQPSIHLPTLPPSIFLYSLCRITFGANSFLMPYSFHSLTHLFTYLPNIYIYIHKYNKLFFCTPTHYSCVLFLLFIYI